MIPSWIEDLEPQRRGRPARERPQLWIELAEPQPRQAPTPSPTPSGPIVIEIGAAQHEERGPEDVECAAVRPRGGHWPRARADWNLEVSQQRMSTRRPRSQASMRRLRYLSSSGDTCAVSSSLAAARCGSPLGPSVSFRSALPTRRAEGGAIVAARSSWRSRAAPAVDSRVNSARGRPRPPRAPSHPRAPFGDGALRSGGFFEDATERSGARPSAPGLACPTPGRWRDLRLGPDGSRRVKPTARGRQRRTRRSS